MSFFTPDDFEHPKFERLGDVRLEVLRKTFAWCASIANQKRDAEIERLRAENERLRDGLHTCHAGCTKAGCVNARLREALRAMLERYLSLVNSGDAGFWDPETEDEVIAARAALEGT